MRPDPTTGPAVGPPSREGDAEGPSRGRRFRLALLIDDHPLFCDALSMTLRTVAGIEEVETAQTLARALDLVNAAPPGRQPDVVALDLHLPDVQGLDGLIRLRASLPRTPIVVVSSRTENRIIGSAMRAGADGFVPKHSGRETFERAFAALRRGERFLPDGYVAVTDPALPLSGPEDAIKRLAMLTQQQSRIMTLICEGKLNKQIAFELGIAETTVKAHVTAIMRKLGVQSRTQAVLIAKEASFASILPSEV